MCILDPETIFKPMPVAVPVAKDWVLPVWLFKVVIPVVDEVAVAQFCQLPLIPQLKTLVVLL